MNTESNSHLPPPPPSSTTAEETPSLPLPSFLSSSSSSIKPLRERNRTNLKRRANLSRSQVLSHDFENDDNLNHTSVPTTVTTNSQPIPSTRSFHLHCDQNFDSIIFLATIHPHAELYSKTISPKTPSPIHNTVTCSQVWERLASNEEHQNPISPKPVSAPTTSLPTHISFSYDPSDDDEEGENLPQDDKDDFQYVPVSSQSKLVQFQFLTFARQQQLTVDNGDHDENNKEKQYYDSDDDDEDDDDEEEEDTLVAYPVEDHEEEQEVSVIVVKDIFISHIVSFRIDHLRNANDQYPRRIPSMVFLLFLQQTTTKRRHHHRRRNNLVRKSLKSKIRMLTFNV